MQVLQFRSTDLPPADRFGVWHEMATQSHVGTIISTRDDRPFDATISTLDLGGIQLSALTYPPLRAHRSRRLIRESDPGFFHVSMMRRGSVVAQQSRRETLVRPGELILYDTSVPCVVVNEDPMDQVVIQIPRDLLPLRAGVLERALGRSVSAVHGIGGVTATVVARLLQAPEEYRLADAARLSTVVADLLAGLFAGDDQHDHATVDARHRTLSLRVLEYIERRLSDPELTPAAIAAAHHMSVRSLQVLFQQEGLTIGGWIRDRRLERCRRELADPGHDARTVAAIGARWGLPNPTSFSRAFRRAYGTPPSDYRRAVRGFYPDSTVD